LLRALDEQLAFGVGTSQSELSNDLLRANRANLEYPRAWSQLPRPEAFGDAAARFNERGFVSTHDSHTLVLEVLLADGVPSRMVDPGAETALLHVTLDAPHPTAGVGYLSTIALPFDPPVSEIPHWCSFLNNREHEQEDFVPRLGAWGIRGTNDEIVYSQFWPTDRDGMHVTMMNWMIQRALWIKNRFWKSGEGLVVGEHGIHG
jgi:hypothetical protein